LLTLGIRSLWNRRFVSALTVAAIALSVTLILGVERLRTEARSGFANSASGIDLIVAARGNPVQILLATVFGVGATGNGIGWESYEMVTDLPGVDWTVPIAMGDNHRGYPVIGTSRDYFQRFRHSGGQSLALESGRFFDEGTQAVVGAEVARRLGYSTGDSIVLAHGAGDVSFEVHDDAPFTVTGILATTGTAVDRLVLVSLEGFDALHEDDTDESSADPFAAMSALLNRENTPDHDEHDDDQSEQHDEHDADHDEHDDEHDDDHEVGHENHDADHDDHEHAADQINAVYVGLVDRSAILGLQRSLSEYPGEPLTAVMPNVALLELWSITGTAESALSLMALAVALAGMLGLMVMLSAALESRRREFAILRSVGAAPWRIFSLVVLEALLLTLAGLAIGYLALMTTIGLADTQLAQEFGLRLSGWAPSLREWGLMAAILAAGLLASLLPAIRVYRITLADGLSSSY
jgi:putative ABC transport system permease protein